MRRAFNATGLAIWTRQLAGLVSAGLSLKLALTAPADEAEAPCQRDFAVHLRAEAHPGASLGTAQRRAAGPVRAKCPALPPQAVLAALMPTVTVDGFYTDRGRARSRKIKSMIYMRFLALAQTMRAWSLPSR